MLEAELTRANAAIAELRAENAELRRRLDMDSRNSSKPPSTDSPFDKPAPKSLRRRSGRKPPGGQPGHPGSTLRQVADPDDRRRARPCGVPVLRAGAGRPLGPLSHPPPQEFDIPPVTIKVTEHQLIERDCVCGHSTRADAPAGLDARAQYGPRG